MENMKDSATGTAPDEERSTHQGTGHLSDAAYACNELSDGPPNQVKYAGRGDVQAFPVVVF